MEFDFWTFIIGLIIGFLVGIFVYRNNVDMFGPIAGKIDVKFDELKLEIKKLKDELKTRNTRY